jgi:hypothetical protein
VAHIKEVDEHLDWETWMNEGLPDDAGHGEYTQALGRRNWDLLHGLADNYGCDACKPTFQAVVSAAHDLVNIELGKGVYDPQKFQKAVKMYEEALDKWVASGSPIHKDSPLRDQPHEGLSCPKGKKGSTCRQVEEEMMAH